MGHLFEYLILSSVILSILFLVFRMLYNKETNFRQLRYFLILSVILSVLLPLNTYRINFSLPATEKNTNDASFPQEITRTNPITNTLNVRDNTTPAVKYGAENKNWSTLIFWIYASVSVILLSRLIYQLIKLMFIFSKARIVRINNLIIAFNKQFRNSFSLFNWIFIHDEKLQEDDLNKILAHEKIHVQQMHSIDTILIELLAAVMWFNPFVWMMRNSMQLVHEYLADEGALSTGIDKLGYQALLLNHVAEGRLVSLSSSFNHSLIKKRMIMITKSNVNRKTKLKILALLPIAAILFIGVSCLNGQDEPEVVAAVAPTKMNVMYLGLDNPVNIAVSGYEASELEVEVENGRIIGENGNYIVRPIKPGTLTVEVRANGKVVNKSVFRVKTVPNPVAKFANLKGGEILLADLLSNNEVKAVMENFDFDLRFEVVSFAVSAVIDGYVKEYRSDSNILNNDQKDLLSQLKSGDKVYFEEIKCKGPTGTLRKLPTISFKIK